MTSTKSYFVYAQDGHRLEGVFANGRWAFTCDDYPDLAAKFDGATETGPCLIEFQRRAMVGHVTARRLRGGK